VHHSLTLATYVLHTGLDGNCCPRPWSHLQILLLTLPPKICYERAGDNDFQLVFGFGYKVPIPPIQCRTFGSTLSHLHGFPRLSKKVFSTTFLKKVRSFMPGGILTTLFSAKLLYHSSSTSQLAEWYSLHTSIFPVKHLRMRTILSNELWTFIPPSRCGCKFTTVVNLPLVCISNL